MWDSLHKFRWKWIAFTYQAYSAFEVLEITSTFERKSHCRPGTNVTDVSIIAWLMD
jgi:hypothetical protein